MLIITTITLAIYSDIDGLNVFCQPSSAAPCVARLSGERYTSNLRFQELTQHS